MGFGAICSGRFDGDRAVGAERAERLSTVAGPSYGRRYVLSTRLAYATCRLVELRRSSSPRRDVRASLLLTLIPSLTTHSLSHHAIIMNSVSQLLEIISQSVLASFAAAIASLSSQTWSIKMGELPPLPCTEHRGPSASTDRMEKVDKCVPSTAKLAESAIRVAQPREERNPYHYHHNHFALPTSPSLDSPSPSPSSSTLPTYLCTFCWRPHHPTTTPSRVIGRRARLACTPCHNALLDLAVC